MVLDRASPLDTTWGSPNDTQSCQPFSTEFKGEIKSNWRHFKPSSPPEQIESSNDTTSSNPVDTDHVRLDDITGQCHNFDSQTTDSLFFDAGLDGFRVPTSEYSPPCVTNSNFNVIGDTTPSAGTIDLDWWNYFDPIEHDTVTNETSIQEVNGKKTYSTHHVNGVGSPSTATDTSFWKIPKSAKEASLPNNDW